MLKRILIVEDEAILYKKLQRLLLKEQYEVSDYVPSVEQALVDIDACRPDLVLLDIDLQGEYSGLDLGKKLSEEYNIPFIYISIHSDADTFYKGLHTSHEQFIVKTKPTLNVQELLNAVRTVLFKNEISKNIVSKIGLLVTDDYKEKLKGAETKDAVRHTVAFSDIAFFSKKKFLSSTGELEKVKKDYVAVCTKGKDFHLYAGSIVELNNMLPEYFLRVNEGEIINVRELQGRINGRILCVQNLQFEVGRTYRKQVIDYLERLFGK